MKWIVAYYATVTVAGLSVAVAWWRQRRCQEHHRLAIEEAQMLHDYLHARAEVAYLELKYAAECAEDPW
jgi:hypothetical protein